MNWFYAQNGQQAGPVADEELAQLVQRGVVTSGTLVWHSGLAGWQPYSEIAATLPPASGGGSINLAKESAAGGAVGGSQAVCSQCGGVFPPDDVVRVSGYDVCARCKPLLLQKLQQGVPNAGVFGVQTMRYAGFWIRFAAAIVDGLILLPFSFLLQFLYTLVLKGIYDFNPMDPQNAQLTGGFLASLGVYYLVIFALTSSYNGLCFSRWGGMPGMLICGLRVTRGDGQRVSFLRGVGRYFAAILSGVVFGMGYLFVVFDDQKRALHDYICDTRVIYK